ncbi:MAG: sensor histidine kinase [Gemmatimonadales bacterium]
MAASVLIVVLSLATGAFAIGYAGSVRARRAQAIQSAQTVAQSILTNVLDRTLQQGWPILLETFVPAFTVSAHDLRATVLAMEARGAGFASSCGCDPMRPSAISLIDLDSGASAESHPSGTPGLGPASREAIRAFADTTPPDIRAIHVLPLDEPSGPAIAHLRVLHAADGRRIAVTIVVPLTELGPRVFAPAREGVIGTLFGDVPAADSLFGIEVEFGETEVYRSPWVGEGVTWQTRYWSDARPLLQATITLNPARVERLLPGGIPRVPTALLTLGTLLVFAAAAASLFALHRARRLMATRTLFLSGVSHELRTPLTQILLYTEILEGSPSDPGRRRHALEVIGRETRRLILMIENVLLFARGRRSDLPLNVRTQDPAPLVESIVSDLGPLLTRAGVAIDLELTARRAVRLDAAAFRQILLNLIDNAIRYGPAGQRIRVGLSDDEARVRLSVADQGPGISEATWSRIQRGEPAPPGSSAAAGAGLGLPLVRQLASAMGATVQVARGPTGGATVTVVFPAVGPTPAGEATSRTVEATA